jgi:hypothetical protein
VIPRLCARCIDVHAGLENARIVEAGSQNDHQVRREGRQAEQTRSTVWTETSLGRIAAIGFRFEVLDVTCDLDRTLGHSDCGRIGTPARLLTVAAMTIAHEYRCSGALVPDGPAHTTTFGRSGHNRILLLCLTRRLTRFSANGKKLANPFGLKRIVVTSLCRAAWQCTIQGPLVPFEPRVSIYY